MTDELPEITEVQRLRIEPGDRLVVRVGRDGAHLTPTTVGRITALVRDRLRLGDEVPVMIIPSDADVSVLKVT